MMMFVSVLASNQGGWGGFFTSLSSGCEFLLTRPNYQFFPPLFTETLDASSKEGFSFYEPNPQPFDGWTGSHLPHCSDEKRCFASARCVKSVHCDFDVDLATCFSKKNFLTRENKFLKSEWSWSENKFHEDGILAIDSLVAACTCLSYIYIWMTYVYCTCWINKFCMLLRT